MICSYESAGNKRKRKSSSSDVELSRPVLASTSSMATQVVTPTHITSCSAFSPEVVGNCTPQPKKAATSTPGPLLQSHLKSQLSDVSEIYSSENEWGKM